jgi:hypothetical protein
MHCDWAPLKLSMYSNFKIQCPSSELYCFDACFRLLNLLQELQPPKDVIFFAVPVNSRVSWKKHPQNSDICTTVVRTATQGAEEW